MVKRVPWSLIRELQLFHSHKITSHCPKPEGESWPTEHNCTLKLGSWTYDVAEINPNFKGADGDAASLKYMTNKKVSLSQMLDYLKS